MLCYWCCLSFSGLFAALDGRPGPLKCGNVANIDHIISHVDVVVDDRDALRAFYHPVGFLRPLYTLQDSLTILTDD